jgi:hypothetical protein
MISGEDGFSIWAPDGVRWSEWAKPVAFTQLSGLPDDVPIAPLAIDVPGVPLIWTNTAAVVDLPASDSVGAALTLARQGLRPVPLYNGTWGPAAVVDMSQLLAALGAGAAALKSLPIAPDASPAFLLDSNRSWPLGAGEPGRYDNRWVVLPQDFPSATYLRSQAITRVVVFQRDGMRPSTDLTHVLCRWQEAKIALTIVDVAAKRMLADAELEPPTSFRSVWYAAAALFGLRRNTVGGFGSTVPEQTASGRGGFYG